jgi:hypothetical protein
MPTVSAARSTVLLIAAAVIALTVTAGAVFRAPAPGSDLRPTDGAGEVIELLQGNQSILWTALSGTVTGFVVQGWPSSTGDAELGGALVMERIEGGADTGVIEFGEKPMTLAFDTAG